MTPQLPEEVLNRIFSHLSIDKDSEYCEDDQTKLLTMAKVARSSKTFNRVVGPYLYQTLNMVDFGGQNSSRIRRCRLLRSLLQVPVNARYVQQIFVAQDALLDSKDTQVNGHLQPEELQSTRSIFKSHLDAALGTCPMSPLVRERLKKELSEHPDHVDAEDAGVALLLALCNNVRVFDFQWCTNKNESLVMCIIAASRHELEPPIASRARPLQRLAQVSMQVDMGTEADPWPNDYQRNLESLFRIPHLETLRLNSIFYDGRCQIDPTFKSQVKRLFLREASIHSGCFSSFLAVFPYLTTLFVQFDDNIETEYRVKISELGRALRESKLQKLETLVLVTLWTRGDSDEPSDVLPIGSLTSLTSLRTLTIQYECFFGTRDHFDKHRSLADTLPTSLHTLNIFKSGIDQRVWRCLDKQIRQLMRDERFRHLKINERTPPSQ